MSLRLILLIVGSIIVLLIAWDGWRRLNKESDTKRLGETPEPDVNEDDGLQDPLFKHKTNTQTRTEPVIVAKAATTTPGADDEVVSAKQAQSQAVPQKSAPEGKREKAIFVLNVIARDNKAFDGPNLLQALLSSGLRHGAMSIFHRYEQGTDASKVLFSVASAVEPGVFDLNAMGQFSTPGLSIFMSLPGPADPILSYELMVETAERLAERLGGEVFDDKHQQLTEDAIQRGKALILSYQNKAQSKVSVNS